MSKISQLSIKRLFNRVGIKRVKSDSYDKLNTFIYTLTSKIINNSLTLSKIQKTQFIISESDIQNSLVLEDILKIVEKNEDLENINNHLIIDKNIELLKPMETIDNNINNSLITSIPKTQFIGLVNIIVNELCIDKQCKISKKAINKLHYLVEANTIQYLLDNKYRNNILGNKEFIL